MTRIASSDQNTFDCVMPEYFTQSGDSCCCFFFFCCFGTRFAYFVWIVVVVIGFLFFALIDDARNFYGLEVFFFYVFHCSGLCASFFVNSLSHLSFDPLSQSDISTQTWTQFDRQLYERMFFPFFRWFIYFKSLAFQSSDKRYLFLYHNNQSLIENCPLFYYLFCCNRYIA